MPSNCSIVLTCNPTSAAAKGAKKRGWDKTVKMKPLSVKEKREIIVTYLALVHKTFEDDVLKMICNAEQTSNILFLRMLLDELLTTAVFETVKTITKTCLTCKSPRELCDMVLGRYEHDFGAALVQRAFSLIHSSRYGLAEPELLELLDAPADVWSPFYLAARECLCCTGGLLNLTNFMMNQAIERRYLKESRTRALYHSELLRFFSSAPEELVAVRFDEAPQPIANELT